jgi:hypothetical protein
MNDETCQQSRQQAYNHPGDNLFIYEVNRYGLIHFESIFCRNMAAKGNAGRPLR